MSRHVLDETALEVIGLTKAERGGCDVYWFGTQNGDQIQAHSLLLKPEEVQPWR